MAKRQVAGAAQVRAWFAELDADAREAAGLADVEALGQRGRLPVKVIDAFNAAHKGKAVHTQGVKVVETIKVTGTRVSESGRKTPVTRTTTLAEVRAWALTQDDLKIGERGKVSSEVMRAFAERAPRA